MYPAGVKGIVARRLALRDDTSIRVLEAGDPAGYPILLVHGWGGFAYSFAELIPALAGAGYRVLAMELPGHGLSDKPADPSRYGWRQLSDDILEVVRTLRLERFAFIGHSMGGLFGLHLASSGELPGVERLVLISSAGLTRIAWLGPLKVLSPRVVDRVVPRLLTRAVIKGVLEGAFGTKERPLPGDVDQYWAQTQWPEYGRACRACLHHVNFRRLTDQELRALRIPVLVITGGRDLVVGRATRRARLIPTARVLHLPEAGHLVMQECATRTNAAILEFLSARDDSP